MNILLKKSTTFLFITLASFGLFAQINMPLGQRAKIARANLYKNISPSDATAGAVIASPSRANPDYYYHWVRDAALVMVPVLQQYKTTRSARVKNLLFKKFHDYINFSRSNQKISDADPNLIDPRFIMGEPKFTVTGGAYNKGWGRPQNDGPALRAITLIQYANQLIKEGKANYVRDNIYRPEIPAHTVVKADLEYTAHHWKMQNFDYWEEVKGFHVTTLMAQRKALLLGAKLASFFNDNGAANYYLKQAQGVSEFLEKFWSPSEGIIRVTLDKNKHGKISGLDVATILGTLHSELPGKSYSVLDPRVHATALQIKKVFQKVYNINKGAGQIATAIGRYPEDVYDGNGFKGGNPWFLAIHAFAELHYRMVSTAVMVGDIVVSPINYNFFVDLKYLHPEIKKSLMQKERIFKQDPRFIRIMKALALEADDYLKRSAFHANQRTGSMAEQINRNTGYMQGARDLTWSYASLLTAVYQRGVAAKLLR